MKGKDSIKTEGWQYKHEFKKEGQAGADSWLQWDHCSIYPQDLYYLQHCDS